MELYNRRQPVGGSPIVDSALDTNSTHCVQNKVVASAINEVNSKLPQYTDLTYAISGLNANGTTRQNQSLSIPTGKNVLGATIISVPDNDWWTASVTNLSNTSCKIIVQNWGSSVTSGNVKVRVAFS